jgi:hypothetical protein
MKHDSIHAALSALRYQHPTGVTTVHQCHRCGIGRARGGGPCVQCLARELVEGWHVPVEMVEKLLAAHSKAREAICELDDVREMVIKAAGG